MMGHVDRKNYQVACSMHFQFAHPNASIVLAAGDMEGVGNHPNAWYRASMKYKQHQTDANKSKETIESSSSSSSSSSLEEEGTK